MNALLLLGTLAASARDREAVLDAAAQYAVHEWTMTAVNQTASCSSSYESDYSPGTYRGLPYDWGGYFTLQKFDDGLADGLGAGSHSWHGVLSCTVGVDCSGYVSQIWGISHHATVGLASRCDAIDLDDVKRADAFNDAGSHVVLYTYETDAGAPIFYEAAGSASKVRLNASAGWSYLDGYTPIREETVTDGPSTATTATPIEITAFPFEHQRWTAGAASDVVDSYSCAPSTDESGPEVWYRFRARTGGTVKAVVSDDSGVDIDLHVLTAPQGSACIARDDSEVEVEVEPGDVWLSLDTFVGSREFPGPYVLTVTFDGEVGASPEEPEEPEDTDVVEPDPDTDVPEDTEVEEEDAPESSGGPGARVPFDNRGCGCVQTPGFPVGWAGALALVALRRRRR
jgi:hypothetical protein